MFKIYEIDDLEIIEIDDKNEFNFFNKKKPQVFILFYYFSLKQILFLKICN